MEIDHASLLRAASEGDADAWNAIVDRYAGLVWTVARGLDLSAADAADVSQTTWLRLVENMNTIREPAGLGAWLATTARREALVMLRKRREVPVSYADAPDDRQAPPWHRVLTEERDSQLRQAFEHLNDRCRKLLRLLVIEPAASYAEAAAALDMPVGSLGPTRARCLDTLRRYLAVLTTSEGGNLAI
jgi:RNA polymerase sigma factor (sigma-70 family)